MAFTTSSGILNICRFTSGGVWLYQGVVPKLLGPHRDEVRMISALGIGPELHSTVAYVAGASEVALGLCILVLYRRAWPHIVSALTLAGMFVFVALFAPAFLGAAFNPVVANSAVIALSVIAVLIVRERVRNES